jgi:hypothetical protein
MRFIFSVLFSLILLVSQDGLYRLDFKGAYIPVQPVGGKSDNECTIMVISGQATADGRPILWKNRDVTNADQRFLYVPPHTYPDYTSYGFTGNFYTNNDNRCYMGVNDVGFAIINANCYNLTDDLRDGIDDGDLMKWALERCATVEDWEELLATSGIYGRKDCWLFGAMDTSGAAKLYECDNFRSTVYDANNVEDAPDGYLVRSVFALIGGPPPEGLKRYNRACYLVEEWTRHYPIDVKFILQKMSRDLSFACGTYYDADDPYPLPFYGRQGNLPDGYINTNETINRYKTRSCAVIRGVLPDEDPRLATLFAVLGQPVLSVAVPLWTGAQYVPYCLRGEDQAPWYEIIAQRMDELYPVSTDWYMDSHYLLDSLRTGVLSWSLALEDWGIASADQKLADWRENGPDMLSMRQGEIEIGQHIWNGFVDGGGESTLDAPDVAENLPREYISYNYPNPFNPSTTISFEMPDGTDPGSIIVNVYTILGEKVRTLPEVQSTGGAGSVVWDGRDDAGRPAAAGMYMYVVNSPQANIKGKMLLLK